MSIYATLWTLKFPKEGDAHFGCDWITVTAQAVPAHIGSPTRGCGDENGDPFASFLPPPIETNADGNAPHRSRRISEYHRAVVFVTEHSLKGTARSGQEYVSPLLVLTGQEYAGITFEELPERICEALRGNRAPILAEMLLPGGTHQIIRSRKTAREAD